MYLGLNASGNFVETSPLVLVLCPAANDKEALQDVDDIVDPPTFDPQLFGAAVQEQDSFALDTVAVEEPSAELTKRFLFT